jgi:hypothetical protein
MMKLADVVRAAADRRAREGKIEHGTFQQCRKISWSSSALKIVKRTWSTLSLEQSRVDDKSSKLMFQITTSIDWLFGSFV